MPASRHRRGDARQVLGLVGRGHRDRPLLGRRSRSRSGSPSSAARRSNSAPSAAITSTRCSPTCALSCAGVPAATSRPRSISTTRSASASASSRYWVVSSSVTPVVHERADRRPDDLPAAGVKTRGRLVEHEHVRGVDQAGGEVDAAALAAGQVLDQPVAELLDREPLDQLRRRPRRDSRRPARAAAPSARGSRARSGACRARRTGRSARSARGPAPPRATTSWPATRA